FVSSTDTGEVDLDALLEDLCIMEKDLNNSSNNTESFVDNSFSPKPNSPLSPTVKVPADVRSRLESVQEENKELTLEEQQERIKAEKIRIALEKLRAARVKKLVVKVYNDEDPTSKTIAIDQTWTAWEVSKKMMIKNDAEPDPNWSLVERLSELCIERCLEDHESVVDIVSYWPWENENRIVISNKREKYALFKNPQNYLLSSGTSAGAAQLAEKSKDILLQEHFQPDAMRLPELDGVLYLKEGKKSWKKHYFVLRASGIYYAPKGKTKVGTKQSVETLPLSYIFISRTTAYFRYTCLTQRFHCETSSKDLVCLVKFEYASIYNGGAAFKKKFKAPTEHCFVLKHPEYHDIDSKAIKYFCAEDPKTLQRWTVCIRLAKYGYQMLDDYATTQDEMERLAFSLDKNRFPKSSSFSAGQKSNVPQITDARDKAVNKAKAQSDRLKLAIGTNNPGGSQSFSVSRKISSETKQQKKSIGNLFSDAWKKGTEPEEEFSEPISPSSPSSTGPGMTPNSLEPKSFNIDNDIIMDQISEEEPAHPKQPPNHLDLVPTHPTQPPNHLDLVPTPPTQPPNHLDLVPPPPPISSLERHNMKNSEDTNDVTRIPSPTEVKSMLESLQWQSPPPLPHKGVSILPHAAQHTPAPVPPMAHNDKAPPYSIPAPPMAHNDKARSSSSPPNPSVFSSSPRSPLPEVFTAHESPLPPPPVARKPSRSNSVLSQKSIEEEGGDDPFCDQTADFPPPPPLPNKETVPPPVKRKPSRSGSMNGNKKITRVAEMGSTDSLDNIPPPPPLEMMPLASDADLPPPPPEVLFTSQARSHSESRDRANSKPAPPPPPPKKGRSRTNSSDKGPLPS
ncbi:hypothetical protein QZH41_017364, partial [Actinostola sp. cb2023]